MNPATFLQVHAKLERPFRPWQWNAGFRVALTATRITPRNPHAYRVIIIPGTAGFTKHTSLFITPTHAAQPSTRKTESLFTTAIRPFSRFSAAWGTLMRVFLCFPVTPSCVWLERDPIICTVTSVGVFSIVINYFSVRAIGLS